MLREELQKELNYYQYSLFCIKARHFEQEATMKNRRVIAFVLVFVLFCSSALAETITPKKINEKFSIRNGIHLGITQNEVDALEDATKSDNNSFWYWCHDDNEWNSHLIYEQVTVAGYPGCQMCYSFDKDGVLQDLSYLVSLHRDDYSVFNGILTNKYGTPQYMKPGLFDTEAKRVISRSTTVQSGKIEQFAGWLVKYDDCYVKVELVGHTLTVGNLRQYLLYVGYRIITPEDYQMQMNIQEQVNDWINDSINNTL